MRRFVITFLAAAIAAALSSAPAEAVSLSRIWETDKVFDTPESVIYDAEFHVLYVSNIGGSPLAKDGNGYISKLSMKGELVEAKWVDGLNAPKGMAIFGRKLYVTDITDLVEIDIEKGRVLKRYPAAGAVFLNDAAVDGQGRVYVSDYSRDNSAIYRLFKGKLEVWKRDRKLSRPNGLCVRTGKLIVGVSGDAILREVDLEDRGVTDLAVIGSGIDGITCAHGRNLIVSDWSGRTMYVDREGGIQVLLDTTESGINSADIWFIPKYDMLLIPTFNDGRVVACRLNH